MGEGGDKMVADCYSCYLQGLNKAAKKPQAPSSKPEEAKGPQLTKEAPPGEPPPPLLENPREGLGDLLDVQLVGQDYVEEVLNNKYNMVCFHCKLCECSFNDPKAKDMHLKGRQHHLQYKGFPAELQKHSSSSVDAMVPRGFGEIGRDQAQQPDSDVAGGPLAPGGRAALAPGNEKVMSKGYEVVYKAEEASIVIASRKWPQMQVTVSLTSLLLCEEPHKETEVPVDAWLDPGEVLDPEKCLESPTALRHTKWFQPALLPRHHPALAGSLPVGDNLEDPLGMGTGAADGAGAEQRCRAFGPQRGHAEGPGVHRHQSAPPSMPCGCLLSTKSTGSWAWICWRQQSTG